MLAGHCRASYYGAGASPESLVIGLHEQLETALAGRYQIERELGRGGLAIVYLARDLKHARRVAVKVLRPELATSLGADRFLLEINVAAGLSHPHIVAHHVSTPPPSLCAERSSCPAAVDVAVRRALAKIPADRFRRAGDLAGAQRTAARRRSPELRRSSSSRTLASSPLSVK
jgi:hypothetical protein